MKSNLLTLAAALLLVLSVNARPAFAQTSVARSIFGSGGLVVSNDAYRLVGTLGQPAVGSTQGGGVTFNTGYWTRLNPFTPTAIEEIPDLGSPSGFVLAQNYPNPFASTTRIPFDVAEQTHVTLEVYDILGRRVVSLVDETLAPGRYEAPLESDGLVAGMYLYRVRMADYEETKQMIIVR